MWILRGFAPAVLCFALALAPAASALTITDVGSAGPSGTAGGDGMGGTGATAIAQSADSTNEAFATGGDGGHGGLTTTPGETGGDGGDGGDAVAIAESTALADNATSTAVATAGPGGGGGRGTLRDSDGFFIFGADGAQGTAKARALATADYDTNATANATAQGRVPADGSTSASASAISFGSGDATANAIALPGTATATATANGEGDATATANGTHAHALADAGGNAIIDHGGDALATSTSVGGVATAEGIARGVGDAIVRTTRFTKGDFGEQNTARDTVSGWSGNSLRLDQAIHGENDDVASYLDATNKGGGDLSVSISAVSQRGNARAGGSATNAGFTSLHVAAWVTGNEGTAPTIDQVSATSTGFGETAAEAVIGSFGTSRSGPRYVLDNVVSAETRGNRSLSQTISGHSSRGDGAQAINILQREIDSPQWISTNQSTTPGYGYDNEGFATSITELTNHRGSAFAYAGINDQFAIDGPFGNDSVLEMTVMTGASNSLARAQGFGDGGGADGDGGDTRVRVETVALSNSEAYSEASGSGGNTGGAGAGGDAIVTTSAIAEFGTASATSRANGGSDFTIPLSGDGGNAKAHAFASSLGGPANASSRAGGGLGLNYGAATATAEISGTGSATSTAIANTLDGPVRSLISTSTSTAVHHADLDTVAFAQVGAEALPEFKRDGTGMSIAIASPTAAAVNDALGKNEDAREQWSDEGTSTVFALARTGAAGEAPLAVNNFTPVTTANELQLHLAPDAVDEKADLLLTFLDPIFEAKEASGGHLEMALKIHLGSTLIHSSSYANLDELLALEDTTIQLGILDPALYNSTVLSIQTLFSAGDEGDRFSIGYLLGSTPQQINEVVPEPGTGSLLGLGLALLAAKRRRRQRRR